MFLFLRNTKTGDKVNLQGCLHYTGLKVALRGGGGEVGFGNFEKLFTLHRK